MCGIFGWHFKKGAPFTKGQRLILVSVLAAMNESRGSQSWGLHVQSKGRALTSKNVGPITKAVCLADYARYPIGFGHTRAPTTGDVCQANAHPFTYKGFTLAHNGVIYNHDDLMKGAWLRDTPKVNVDSEHLVRALAGDMSFSQIKGYGAIVWTKEGKPGDVYLCRMRMGDLEVFGLHDDQGRDVGAVWSSDGDHAIEAMKIAGMDDDYYCYRQPKEGKVYVISDGMLRKTHEPDIELASGTGRTWESYGVDWADHDTAALERYYAWRERRVARTQAPETTVGAHGLCAVCYGNLTESGWCMDCQKFQPRYAEKAVKKDPEQAIVSFAEQLGLQPQGPIDWQDSSGNTVTRGELLDLMSDVRGDSEETFTAEGGEVIDLASRKEGCQ